MAGIKDKIKQTWEAITLPVGIDAEYDCQCDEAFLRFLDKVNTASWFFFSVIAFISLYLLITRELL